MLATVSRMRKLTSVSVVPENTTYGSDARATTTTTARAAVHRVGRRDRVTRTGSASGEATGRSVTSLIASPAAP